MASTLPDLTSPHSNVENESFIGPQLQWEQTDVNLQDLVELQTLPIIGAFEEGPVEEEGDSKRLSAGLKIYSRQPVMFHKKTKKRQVKARTIHKDKHGMYMEIGQSLIIPEGYNGWFEVIPSDFTRSNCYRSIGAVAEEMPKRLFTRSHIRALRVEGEGENQKFLERKVAPGTVLETKGRFRAKLKTKAQTGLFKKKTKEWEMQEVCYLKCIDSDQKEVLIPFDHTGKFNAVYEGSKLSQNAVYNISDIMNDLTLPVRVRLLYGKAPVVPCLFTGMLVLRNLDPHYEAIIGSTVLNSRNVLFEIPMDSNAKVSILSDDAPFKDMPSYRDAKKLCEKYSKLYDAMIKLSPDLDTDQKLILHMPSDPKVMEQTDEALRALDLVTDISLNNEPTDHMFNSSDSGSVQSEDKDVLPKGGILTDVEEFKSSESQTHV